VRYAACVHLPRLSTLLLLVSVGCERPPGERPPTTPGGGGHGAEPGADAPSAGPDRGEVPDERPSVANGERALVVPEGHPLHARLEVPDMPNACQADAECHVGGCSAETCSAEPEVITTCELLPVRLPEGSQCGCVQGQCRWWHPEGAALVEMGASTRRPEPATGEAPDDRLASCNGERCKPGQECVTYLGIAGTHGPEFRSCEWRCRPGQRNDGCPDGTRCRTIADGPGSVCR
jgi:eight-cysteine-cluster-containing protein